MVAFGLARRGATVVGLDQSEQMLARARRRAATKAEDNPRFIQGEAEHLPFADGEFDALTFTYLLRYVDDRRATMRELARVVKPSGRIGMVEFGVPRSRALRELWRVHTRVGRCSDARCRPPGSRSGASSGPTSRRSTPPNPTSPRSGKTPASPR
jgi:demethylmenaquinone methyltransferase/2-methoxy-6-polyprenyl-1,4-benzoquinol methylase